MLSEDYPIAPKVTDDRVYVLIPALNEAETIARVVEGVAPYGMPLVVSDGSEDETAKIARDAGAVVLELKRNRGYEGALDAGFAYAVESGADFVVTFDADEQFRPEVLEAFKDALAKPGIELVLGIRPNCARLAESLFGFYTRLRFGVRDILCGVKAYPVGLYNSYGRFDSGASVGTELALFALRCGRKFDTVPVQVRERTDGGSRFGFGWRANQRIIKALSLAISADWHFWLNGRTAS